MADSNPIAWSNNGNPTVADRMVYDNPNDQPVTDCMRAFNSADIQINKLGRTEPLPGCLISATDKLRLVTDGYYALIAFSGDTKYRPINYLGCGSAALYTRETCLYIPQTDTLINRIAVWPKTGADQVVIYKNFTSRLHLTQQPGYPNTAAYEFDTNNPDFIFQKSQNQTVSAKSIRTSKNGKWLLVELHDHGYVRVNLEDMTMKKVINKSSPSNVSYIGKADISNDGKHIVVMAQTGPLFDIYDINENCGRTIINNGASVDIDSDLQNPCPAFSYQGTGMDIIDGFNSGDYPRFSSDGGEIRFFAKPWISNPKPSYWVTMNAPNYTTPPRLDYLALGDSYSSGEGDIDLTNTGQKSYIAGTNVSEDLQNGIPEEKCHISPQSYPFLLRLNMQLTSSKMKSVACSGAVRDDLYSTAGSYKGQINTRGYPRLEPFINLSLLQESALKEIKPGRVQQINFVERNKPKVATLTIGGNDTGFANKIKECFFNNIAGSCANDKAKADIAKTIRQQYDRLIDLYRQIQNASPQTRIFVLGYPQFITDTGNFCSLNTTIGSDERHMMVQAVSYLNKIIKAAANNAGVTYIDIEDSLYQDPLNDHRLCGQGKDHVTGPTKYGVAAEIQELFHPNKDGQWDMYSKINSALNGDKLSETIYVMQRLSVQVKLYRSRPYQVISHQP